jgi:hypothetical protein
VLLRFADEDSRGERFGMLDAAQNAAESLESHLGMKAADEARDLIRNLRLDPGPGGEASGA